MTYNQVTKPIQDIATDVAKNNAPQSIQDAIKNATTVQDAIKAAGSWLQTATGPLGDYLEYSRQTSSKGLVPMDYQDWTDEQAKKAEQIKMQEIYAQAAATASANATESDKVQQKLEQEYRSVLLKEVSNRSGTLGTEDAKVAQANHAAAIFQQYYDPKTGNYNVPKAQYGELVYDVAGLLSKTGTPTDLIIKDITQKTAYGDLAKFGTYVTGTPFTGTTQEILKQLADSIDRQAQVAEQNRQDEVNRLQYLKPTDLDPARAAALEQGNLTQYTGVKTPTQSIDDYVRKNPKDADNISKMYSTPGATDASVYQWLKDNGKL